MVESDYDSLFDKNSQKKWLKSFKKSQKGDF